MATTRKRNIEIEFLVDDKRAQKSLQNIEGSVNKTGKAFSTAGKLLASGLVADKVVDFARDSIRAYSDLNESLNAIDKSYGAAAAGVKKLGEESARSVGLSNAEFNSLAVSVSSFVDTIAKGSGEGTVTVLDDLTTRIADFASVMNLDVAEAAALFRSGLAGESEPLRRYGKDLSAATVTAHAYATGIAASGEKLTEQQKVLARYSLLMEQTADTAGDFADTSDDLANSQRILASEAENAKAALGENLAPVMKGLTAAGNDITRVLGAVAGGFSNAEGEASGLANTINVISAGGALNIFFDQMKKVADKVRDAEEAQRELEKAHLESLAPAEAQVKVASAADEKYRILGETMGFLADATDDAATAQQKLTDRELEASSPAFKLLKSIERRDTAQQKYNEAVRENGPASSSAAQAAADLVESTLELEAAQADYNAEGTIGKDIISDVAGQVGVLDESLGFLNGQLDTAGGKTRQLFTPADISRIRQAKEQIEATRGELLKLPTDRTTNVRINVNTIGLSQRLLKEVIEESRRR